MGSELHSIELEELLEHAGWLTALARRLVADSGVADDLVQETWLAALRSPPGHRGNLRGWLGSVLRNVARQRGRRGSSRADIGEGPGGVEAWVPGERGGEEGGAPDELASALETQRLLAEQVLALEEPYRRAVILRYWHGLDASAIGRREGVVAGTVRWRLKQGLDRLRTRLDERHGGDRRAWCLALVPLARQPVAPMAGSTGRAGDGGGHGSGAGAAGGARVPGGARVAGGAVGSGLMGLPLLGALAVAAGGALVAWPVLEGWMEPVESDGVATAATPGAVGGYGESGSGPVAAIGSGFAGRAAPVQVPRRAASGAGVGAPAAGRDRERDEGSTELHLTVVDERGRPVPDVRLSVLGFEPLEVVADDRGGLEARCTIPHRFAPVSFLVAADGFASEVVEGVVPEEGPLHLGRVVLGPGGELRGRVVDAAGEPVAGAWVEADRRSHDAARLEEERLRRSASGSWRAVRTAEDGSFELRGAPAGILRVWAGREGLASACTDELELLPRGLLEGLELVLEPLPADRAISGRVVGPEGEPVGSSLVLLEARGFLGSHSEVTTTDDDGHFAHVCRAGGGAHALSVKPNPASGLGPERLERVRPGGAELVIRLEPARELVIEVRGPDGPLAEPELQLRSRTNRQLAMIGGRFGHPERVAGGTWTLVSPAESFEVQATAPGHEERRFGPFPAGTTEVTCELARLPGVVGRAVDADGRAVAGAGVRLVPVAREWVEIDGFPVRVSTSAAAVVTADGEGAFEATVRERGSFYVQVSAPGFALTELGPLEVDPSEGLELGAVTLTAGGALEGVLGAGGVQASGRIVGASRGDGLARTTRTDGEGRFRFEHLTPGPWQVALHDREIAQPGGSSTTNGFRLPARIPSNQVVREGETTEVVLAGETYVVRGRLELDGRPAAGWSVLASRSESFFSDSGDDEVLLDAEGRFELALDQGGSLGLLLTGSADFSVSVALELDRPLTEWSAELELARVDVAGLEVGGELPPAVWLWEGSGCEVSAVLEPGPDGRVEGLEVPAGRARVVAVTPEAWVLPELLRSAPALVEVDAPAGETTRVELP